MALSKLIVGQISGVAKSAFNMGIAVDQLKEKSITSSGDVIDNKIPYKLPFNTSDILTGKAPLPTNLADPTYISSLEPIPELQKPKISSQLDDLEENLKVSIGVKNDISGALTTLLKPIQTLDKLSDTLTTTITPLNGVITLLKNLPVPTSYPPGAGIPLSIINTFATTLDLMKSTLDTIEGPISSIEPGITQIEAVITPIIPKLVDFDTLFVNSTQIIIFIRLLLAYNGNDLTLAQVNQISVDTTTRVLSGLVTSPGPIVSSNDPDVNAASEAILLDRLQPGSTNPLIYKGYQLEIQYDPDNTFSFPSRRIKGTFLDNSTIVGSFDPSISALYDTDLRLATKLKNDIRYNLPAFNSSKVEDKITQIPVKSLPNTNPYSFSSSVQVLISEIYYEIDQFISGKDNIIRNENAHIIRDSEGIPIGYNLAISNSNTNLQIQLRDQDAINYVEGGNRLSPGLIFDSYRVLTEERSWVIDGVGERVGQIPGVYGTVLSGWIGSKAANYVTNRGGILNPLYDGSLFIIPTAGAFNTPRLNSPQYTYPPFGVFGTIGEVRRTNTSSNTTPRNGLSSTPPPPQFYRFLPTPPTGGPYGNSNLLGTWVLQQPNVSPFTTPGITNGEKRTYQSTQYTWFDSIPGWSINPPTSTSTSNN
tara:strand:+ start:1718 stop:3661 length:1944 start_codon:yes stop_codon:yes gene_type:complete